MKDIVKLKRLKKSIKIQEKSLGKYLDLDLSDNVNRSEIRVIINEINDLQKQLSEKVNILKAEFTMTCRCR